ncbi:hypothetical protein CcI49_19060 [Frankia sp. CcI49]|uniref:ferritin-like domain-containing protein n=1 Tax=unclassified Frankia TaxID=2632575 RepID=UPI0006C9EAB1|nr:MULTISPECIES: ferritin-like protein [unclassified Frankia]ONH58837.1 hypothetical protein CcI49_19060 [Frankia sp. CcI49]
MSYRRTIRETVENGISDLFELQASLLTAIQLEFSTIPPYLCAQWSVRDPDPSEVEKRLKTVVTQEMLHFGLACNMYTATGASLKGEITAADFVPRYPVTGLPGGVHPGLVVGLAPLGTQTLQTFMAIEYPEAGPAVPQPVTPPPPPPPAAPTIGQFYDAIARGFTEVFPGGSLPQNPSPNQVNTNVGADQLLPVNTVADALNAIKVITVQGEGTDTSPDESAPDSSTFAHYYMFAEVYYGRGLVAVGDGFQYAGPVIETPAVYTFSSGGSDGSGQQDFAGSFTDLMIDLESCWTTKDSSIGDAISQMSDLRTRGVDLIRAGITPPFTLTC